MYIISKRMEIAGSHSLKLSYESKCSNVHGHNWIVTVKCASESLDRNGMIIDFTEIKRAVMDKFDHKNINDEMPAYYSNPTAENIAHYICSILPYCCYEVSVQESEGNIAIYRHSALCKELGL